MPFRSKIPSRVPGLSGHVADEELDTEQVVALAALRGPVALAEAELVEAGRRGSIAMVIVPAEPPGRLTSDFVRSIVSGRTRVVVVASSGRLAPGNFERLLRLSLPDVESDIGVVDAGEDLSSAIEAAEAAGFYEPGHALQVFCDPGLVAGFEEELRSGGLSVDPTVVTVSAAPAGDDPDDVISAVHSGDDRALRATLDPHVFADGGVDDYRAVLFKEGLLREFLSDIAPSRELAISRLHDILSGEVGDEEAGALQYLGSGRNGSAYRHPDGFIVKVTTDPQEARSADCLVGANTGHLGRIYQVRPVADGIWMILQEDLERLPDGLREEFDAAMGVLESCGALGFLNGGRLLQAFHALRESDELASVVEVLRRFGVVGMCRELRQLGLTADFHSGNVMLRGDRPVLIDLGTPGDDPGTLREFGSGAPASGAAGPATMRGSNSSSWANGRGALKAPENHVPEDENATEGDVALDWGPGRITGASI